jgi:predicted dehydrogenase
MRHPSTSRRRFLRTAAAGAAAIAFTSRNVLAANDTVNMGFIGLGGRGMYSAEWFGKLPNVKVAGVCDADAKMLDAAKKKYPTAKAAQDLRKIIDDKDIDAVVISTCNHWHALAAIWACQAGKDVYVEKPVSNNVWEGRKIVEAARKYNRVVQGGTQQRSDPVQVKIRDLIKSEELGKMQWVRGNRFGSRASIGKQAEPLKPPATVDYDLWLGPAQDEPMYRKQFHYDWHWMWNTGSGEMGNWGVHILDDIRNILSDRCTLPPRILAGGGRVAWDDAGETPNVHVVYFDTGVVPVIFSLSNLPRKPGMSGSPAYRSIQSGYVIQFENGYYAGGRGGGASFDNAGKKIAAFKGDGGEAHAKNFIDAVRSRDYKSLNGEIEQIHYSSSWCHLANIAFRLGGQYGTEQALAAAKDFAPWKELVEGFETHLTANEIDPAKAGLKLSTMLSLDPKTEQFTGPTATPRAQELLRRVYRKPYIVPDVV